MLPVVFPASRGLFLLVLLPPTKSLGKVATNEALLGRGRGGGGIYVHSLNFKYGCFAF